jgi:hypothetical protein
LQDYLSYLLPAADKQRNAETAMDTISANAFWLGTIASCRHSVQAERLAQQVRCFHPAVHRVRAGPALRVVHPDHRDDLDASPVPASAASSTAS